MGSAHVQWVRRPRARRALVRHIHVHRVLLCVMPTCKACSSVMPMCKACSCVVSTCKAYSCVLRPRARCALVCNAHVQGVPLWVPPMCKVCDAHV